MKKLHFLKGTCYVMLIAILVLLNSCETEEKLNQEILSVPVNFEIERFERDFKDATPDNFETLVKQYAFLFPQNANDSTLVSIQSDSLQQQLFGAVEKKFPDLDKLKEDLTLFFQHLKYYDETFNTPRVITVTSYVDYRNKTIVTDSLVLIALDTYMGAEHEFYGNIPKYITQNMNPDQIVSDLATRYSEKYVFQSQKKTLLDEMIYFGKQLYFKDQIIPFTSEAQRIGYTEEQLEWALVNELQIWTYFIDKEMLYSTDSSLPNRFIAPAPFSKFYLQLDSEAPGRLGQFVGWQIVRSYMENNDISWLRMLKLEADEIFKNSKYKPKK